MPTGPGRALPLVAVFAVAEDRPAAPRRRWGRRVAPDGGDRESTGDGFRHCPGPPSIHRVTACGRE
jgi:hypothetical protein